MSTRWKIAGAAAVGIAAAALTARWLAGASVEAVAVARRDVVQRVVATGRVLPAARVSVGSSVGGTVAKVLADEGAKVRAGDLLVQFEDREARAAVARARAGVEQADARIAQLKSSSAPLAEQALHEAESEAEHAGLDAEREKTLFASGAATRRELDDALKARDVAESRLAAARIRLRETGAGGSEERLARAAVAEAHAALLEAETRLAYTRVEAPVDGTILSRNVERGDAVQATKPLFVLAREGRTRLQVEPDEKTLALLHEGQAARASADAFPSRVFDANVSSIAPAVDAARGTVTVKLDVPQPPDFLRPDMTVSVDVEVGRKTAALVLPTEAIRDAATAAPWVLAARDGRAEKIPVSLGISGDGITEIAKGLSEGDLAVVPSSKAAPGDRVRIRVRGGS